MFDPVVEQVKYVRPDRLKIILLSGLSRNVHKLKIHRVVYDRTSCLQWLAYYFHGNVHPFALNESIASEDSPFYLLVGETHVLEEDYWLSWKLLVYVDWMGRVNFLHGDQCISHSRRDVLVGSWLYFFEIFSLLHDPLVFFGLWVWEFLRVKLRFLFTVKLLVLWTDVFQLSDTLLFDHFADFLDAALSIRFAIVVKVDPISVLLELLIGVQTVFDEFVLKFGQKLPWGSSLANFPFGSFQRWLQNNVVYISGMRSKSDLFSSGWLLWRDRVRISQRFLRFVDLN